MKTNLLAGLFLSAALLGIVGCTNTMARTAAPAKPEVEVATVEQRDIPIEREWIGTLDGMVNAAIKAEVTGYLMRQNYTEGSFVRQGQLLFEIDPRPFAHTSRPSAIPSQYFALASGNKIPHN